jgi:hypothetical protein
MIMGAATKVIGPGMYLRSERVPYGEINAVNFSTLKHMAVSPLHYRDRLDNPRESTVGQLRGTAAHTAILEPHKLFSEYAVFDPREMLAEYAVFDGDDRRGSKAWKEFEAANPGRKLIKRSEIESLDSDRRGSRLWNEFEAANGGKKLIKQSEIEQALALRDAVRSSKAAMRYLAKGHCEVTLVWDDPQTGIRCKGRTDWITPDDVVVDVKGVTSAGTWEFGRQAHKEQWHVQQAFYADGYEVLFPMKRPRSVIIAVEIRPPHDVVVYPLDDETIGIGRDAYRAHLERLKVCRATNTWPGRANGEEATFKLPAYAMPDMEDDLELTIGGESVSM